MEIIIILISISVLIATIFVAAFIWSVKSGQYEDTYSPAVRILFENKKQEKEQVKEQEEEKDNPH